MNFILNVFLIDPLEQFDIINFFFFKTPITNISIYVILILFFINHLFFNPNLYSFKNKDWLILKLLVFVKSILKDNLVITKYSTYSYICIIFFFFLVANAIGMIPYSFTLTSSLIITFYVALMFFGGANILGLIINRLSILSLFIPKGVPIVIIPALVIIEIISYFSRVISLSVRLFANMMSGHTLLKILVGFLWLVIYNFFMIFVKFNIFSFLILFLPWIIIIAVTVLECAIAFLQAYVFTVLSAIYLNDTINLH